MKTEITGLATQNPGVVGAQQSLSLLLAALSPKHRSGRCRNDHISSWGARTDIDRFLRGRAKS